MTKRPQAPDDWSNGSKALLQAVRDDHEPSSADRARVRSALARKLAEAAHAQHAGDAEATRLIRGASRTARGVLAPVGLGLACLVAGAFVWLQVPDTTPPTAATHNGQQASAHRAATAERVQERLVVPAEPVASAETQTPPAVVRRSRAPVKAVKSVSAPKPARVPAQLMAAESPARESSVAEQPVAEQKHDVAEPPAALPMNRPYTQPAPAASASATEDDSAARAELAFIGRINAALLEQEPQTALTLCSEHAQLWPHGMFVQEREGLRAIAACGSHTVNASALARAFLARYAHAALTARLRRACATQLTP